jgi:MFS family permease
MRLATAAVCWTLAYQGYTFSINGIAAPFIARDFGLDDGGIAALYAWITLSAFGVLLLSGMADRIGRRRVLLACLAGIPLAALAAAASHSLVAFALFEIVLHAALGAAASAAVVMVAEVLPVHLRARGQALGGAAAAVGAGLALILMPLLSGGGYSWRWLLVLSGAGITLLPLLIRAIPESSRWEGATAGSEMRLGRVVSVLVGPLRSHALPMLTCAFLSSVATGATQGWVYYHAINGVGLAPSVASAAVLVGGAGGLLGFPLAAWSCDRVGRVRTVVGAWFALCLSALTLYWSSPEQLNPGVWVGAAYLGVSLATNADLVGVRAAVTELFPDGMRSTMVGWWILLGTSGVLASQLLVAMLSGPMGGLSRVVGWLSLLLVPSALIFAVSVRETRGTPADGSGRS